MTEPERSGGKRRIVEVEFDEAAEIMKDPVGAPRLHFHADAEELEVWRAARKSHQA